MGGVRLLTWVISVHVASALLNGDDDPVETSSVEELAVADLLRAEDEVDWSDADEDPLGPVREAPEPGTPQRELKLLEQENRLRSVLPVAWVHIPKCGSSFGNVLIDMPGMCPGIPNRVSINKHEYGEQELSAFKKRWKVLGRGCGKDKFAKWGNHAGMGDEDSARDFIFNHSVLQDPTMNGLTRKKGPKNMALYKEEVKTEGHGAHLYRRMYKKHAMGFFRQPEQRIISGYNHGYHSYPGGGAPTMAMYRQRLQGCAVKMLTRGNSASSGTHTVCGSKNPTQREVDRAVVRLREAFVFVGITDKWQASICTFHAMFGGQCRKSDFRNTRVGSANHNHRYNPAKYGLAGWHDRFDGRLYEEALGVFRAQLEIYNVTQESCGPCLREAGQRLEPDEW